MTSRRMRMYCSPLIGHAFFSVKKSPGDKAARTLNGYVSHKSLWQGLRP